MQTVDGSTGGGAPPRVEIILNWVDELTRLAGRRFSALTASAPLGVPIGIELLGPEWGEPRLIELAFAFEQASASGSSFMPRPRLTVTRPGHAEPSTKSSTGNSGCGPFLNC